jgi:uncharacterized protein YbbK (DUF523 family)
MEGNHEAILLSSACLQGQRVRYDGASKPCAILEELSKLVTLRSICPEVEAGMTIPRPPVQLVHPVSSSSVRVLGRDDATLDVTEQLNKQSQHYLSYIESNPDICGVIFKDKSPSCGLGSTPVFDSTGKEMHKKSSGIIAGTIRQRFPQLLLLEQNRICSERHCRILAQACAVILKYRKMNNSRNAKLVLTLAVTIEKGEWAQAEELLKRLRQESA